MSDADRITVLRRALEAAQAQLSVAGDLMVATWLPRSGRVTQAAATRAAEALRTDEESET